MTGQIVPPEMSVFRLLPLRRVAAFALGLNAAWEFVQCTALYGMWSWEFGRATVWMWGAIAGDVLIVFGVVYVTIHIVGFERLLPLDGRRWIALLVVGFVSGVFLEWISLVLDLWDYTALMPTVVVLRHEVGLSPILQITLLPALSVFLAGRPGVRVRGERTSDASRP